jgi:hypothetical protein
MENIFTIPIYNDSLELISKEVYSITYLRRKSKAHLLCIVVNGLRSDQSINIMDGKQGYKKQILKAVSQYKNGELKIETNKRLHIDAIKQIYSKGIVKNLQNYLIPINKEESRDELTKYKLI